MGIKKWFQLNYSLWKKKYFKVLGVISGIALISGFIYCIVNQNWSDAFLIAAFFFIVHIMPNHLDKINKS